MNTTDIVNSTVTTCPSWGSYLGIGLNFVIIVLGIGKQFLNNKNYTTLTSSSKTTDPGINVNLPTEQNDLVHVDIAENLKSSVKQE